MDRHSRDTGPGPVRAFLEALGGGCNTPLGALAEPADPDTEADSGGDLRLSAFLGRPDGSEWLRGERVGNEPTALGRSLAEDLLSRGARELMAQ